MSKYFLSACLLLGFFACSKAKKQQSVLIPQPADTIPQGKYKNPVFEPILADPAVIKDTSTGTFYAYGTEDDWGDGKGDHLVAIVKSTNLKDWQYINDAFTQKPNWKANGNIWAPDVDFINGKYYMYYAYSIWADPNPGVGLAIADKPQGPFQDKGKLFLSSEIGAANAIDPFYIEDGGKKYLFFGSYSSQPTNGIWGAELSADGTSVLFNTKFRIAAGDFEGTMIHKRGKYYYFFGSKNNCCNGAASIYQVRVGRSETLAGPYLDKDGNTLASWGNGSLLIEHNDRFAGPGHNARIFTDDNGNDWFIYHAIDKFNPIVPSGANRRVLMLDRITWENDWPIIKNGIPSITLQDAPVFKK